MSSAGQQAVFEIPIQPSTAQKINVQLGGTTYNLTLKWQDVDQGGWFLDIADVNDQSIINGIPLVTGADLLAQYKYLNFGGSLIVESDNDPDQVPGFDTLGVTSHLYWRPAA